MMNGFELLQRLERFEIIRVIRFGIFRVLSGEDPVISDDIVIVWRVISRDLTRMPGIEHSAFVPRSAACLDVAPRKHPHSPR